jgi:hypothetical protein
MAARLNRRHQEFVKAKIQGDHLIDRLKKHIDNEIEMTPTQIDAAKFLLNKIIGNAPA